MAKFIINEGLGPRTVDLQGTLSLGSNPLCDVILESSTALGCRCEMRPLRWGYRVLKVKGDLFVNERSIEMADLDHGDTLRVGDVLLLYKQPEGDDFDGADSAGTEQLESVALEELSMDALELIDESAVVAEPEPRREGDAFQRGRWKRIEALRRLSLARQGALGWIPTLSKPGALDLAAELDASGGAAEWDAYEQSEGLQDKTLRELVLLIDETLATVPRAKAPEVLEELEELEVLEILDVLEEIEPRHAHETAGLDDAMVRARHKRLEALRRVRLARDCVFEEWPELSAPGALDVVRALDQEGSASELEVFETSAGLGDSTLSQLHSEVEERRVAAAEAAAAEAAEAEAAAEAAAAEAAAEAAAAEAAAAEAAAAEAEAAAELLPELELLEELDIVEPGALSLSGAAPSAPTPLVTAPQPLLSQGVRPLPPGGVRFTRPLPPGRSAPTHLPPLHPGRMPA